jgi:predicted transcriptional regulator
MKSVAAGKRPAPRRGRKRVFASTTAVRQFEERQTMISLESVEAALRLLTGQNRDLIRIIQAGKFNSMAELAAQSGRAESNLNRTIKKLSNLGLVTLKRERGRLVKTVLDPP